MIGEFTVVLPSDANGTGVKLWPARAADCRTAHVLLRLEIPECSAAVLIRPIRTFNAFIDDSQLVWAHVKRVHS